tara:strand:+ start:383 stop:574 length:192 start_codon:yes stop_codon:yes gene_type:complete
VNIFILKTLRHTVVKNVIKYGYYIRKYLMGIERQGTKATKHDGSVVLLRKILKELKEMNEKIK